MFLCEFSKAKCIKQQDYVLLRLHGKSNSAIIFEEKLILKVAEPLPELHQVVVEGGECSRQGHLGVEMIFMAVGATNINVSVGDGD